MPKYPNTAIETAQIDTEDWEIAFEPYGEDPGAALTLACNLMILKAYIAVEPVEIQFVIEGLDQAMEALYPYTEFNKVSYAMFRRLAEGKLTLDEEMMLNALGVKF